MAAVEKVDNVLMYVLGERDFPLAPVAKMKGEVLAPLGGLVHEAQSRLPDVGYEDVIKLALRIGMAQLPHIYAAGGRVERGGQVSFTPLREGRRAAQQSVARTKLSAAGILDGVLIGDREEFVAATSQAPKDTIPNPQDVAQTV